MCEELRVSLPVESVRWGSYRSGRFRWKMVLGHGDTLWSSSWLSFSGWQCLLHIASHKDLWTHTHKHTHIIVKLTSWVQSPLSSSIFLSSSITYCSTIFFRYCMSYVCGCNFAMSYPTHVSCISFPHFFMFIVFNDIINKITETEQKCLHV